MLGKERQNNNIDATDNSATPDDTKDEGVGDNTMPGQVNGPIGVSDNEDPEDTEDGKDSN